MKRLLFYLRIYRKIVSQNIKARMEYKADFLVGFAGMLFWNVTGVLALWVLFRSVPTIAGWTYDELVFMYGFTVLALIPYEFFFVKLNRLRWDLVDGTFLLYYFRPLDMMFYYMSDTFDVKGFGQLALGLVTIVYAGLRLNLNWGVSEIALIVVLYVSSALIIISILLIAACVGFWVLNSFPIINFAYKLRDIARYPLDIFSNLFRFLFTYVVPIGFIAYYPLQMLFHKTAFNPLVFFSPLVAAGLFALTRAVWKKGVNSYTGTGS